MAGINCLLCQRTRTCALIPFACIMDPFLQVIEAKRRHVQQLGTHFGGLICIWMCGILLVLAIHASAINTSRSNRQVYCSHCRYPTGEGVCHHGFYHTAAQDRLWARRHHGVCGQAFQVHAFCSHSNNIHRRCISLLGHGGFLVWASQKAHCRQGPQVHRLNVPSIVQNVWN